MKIGFIGTGNMGGALARAAAKGGHTLLLANRTPAKAAALAKELGGTVCPNAEAAETAELLFLGVKPQGLPSLAGELAPVLQARRGNAPVVVSMATAVTLRELDAMLGGGLPLIRIMPNTPAAVGAGTILYAAQNVTDAQLNAFRAVLYDKKNPRETFEKENRNINEEIARKRRELGLDNEGKGR